MKIHLIIQRTFNGLKTDFKSEELNLSTNQTENMFGDEQNAAQLAGSSKVFTVQNLPNYRVYSLINGAVADNAGRAGYYAIRFLIPAGAVLVNLRDIFNTIDNGYNGFLNTKNLANQDYSEMLKIILEKNCVVPKTVFRGSADKGDFYLNYQKETNIDELLNEDKTFLVQKLYLFNKEYSKNDQIIQRMGFKPFSALSNEIKKIKVSNPDRQLQELKINNTPLHFGHKENFEIFVFNSDKVTYRAYGEKKESIFNGTNLHINKPKPIYVAPVLPQEPHKKDNGFPLGAFIAVGAAALMFGGAIGWGLTDYFASKKIEQIKDEYNASTPYNFKLDESVTDFILRGDNIPNFASYKFKYSAKDQNWTYNESYDAYKDFGRQQLNKIAFERNLDSVRLIDAFEKFSGKSLQNLSASATKFHTNGGASNTISAASSQQNTLKQTNPSSDQIEKGANVASAKNSEAIKTGTQPPKKTPIKNERATPPKETPTSKGNVKGGGTSEKKEPTKNDDPKNAVNKNL